MGPVGQPGREHEEGTTSLRHRRVPARVIGDEVVVARPADGAPVVLAPTAALTWRLLDDWTTPTEIDVGLAEAYPEVDGEARVAARADIIERLRDDDLLERR